MLGATDRSEQLLEIAQSGTGAAIKAQEEYAQSLEGKFAELANASTLFWQSFFNIEVVSAGVDLLVGFINTMTTLVDTFGTVPTTMAVVSSSLLLFNKNLRGLGTSIVSTLIPSIGNLNKSLTNHSNASKISIAMLQSERAEILSTITAKKAMGVSTKSDTALLMTNTLQLGLNTAGLIANKVAVVALQAAMSMGLSLAITAVTTALTSMIGGMGQASKKATELAEETKSAYDELRSGLESNADGNALIKQYEELSATIEDLNSKIKDNTIPTDELTTAKEKLTEAQTALKDVQEQLIQLYPEASKSIDEQGNLIFGQIEDYKALTQAEREYYDQKLKYLEMEAKANRSSVEAQIAENEEKMKDHQWRYDSHMDSQSKYEYGSEWYNEFGSMASEEAKKLQELAEETQKLRDQLETYDTIIQQANNSQHELIVSTNELTDAKNEQADANDKLNASEETAEERASRLASENKAAAQSYLDLTEDIQQAEEWLDKISEKTFDMSDAQSMLDMFDGFVGDITDITDIQTFLNDKIKEMATSQAEAYAEMKSQDEEFWATKYKNSDDWLNYVDAVEKDIVDIVSSSLGEQGTDFVNHINQLGGFRDVDLSNVKNLADAKGKVESSLVEELKRMWSEYYNAQASVIRESVRQDIIKNNPRASIAQAMAMEQEALKELNAQNEKVTNLLNNINTTVKPTYTGGSGQSYIGKKPTSSSSSSSSSKNKEVADLELTIDRYFKLNNAVDDYTNALKRNQRLQATASPEKKIKLMKEEITLYQKQQKAVKALLNEQKKEAEELKKQLAKKGFTFESDGDLKNYSTRLKQLVKSANSKSGSAKETAIEEVKNIESIIKAYNTLINDTIPDTEDSYLELSESIKEAQRSQLEYVSDIQKQITDALKEELQKRHDETRKALEREKELYLSQYEEEDYNTQLSEQQRKIDEINQQIINLSRDTSLAGQLKLEQLMLEYEEQVEAMNQMIRDKEKENGSNAFDNMLNELDEKLEESLDEKALANMVNQALTQGFIALDGEIISTENLLTQMLERSGEAFTALGQTLRDELIEGLEVAKGLIAEIGGLSFNGKSVSSITATSNSRSVQDYGLTTASVNSRSLSTLSASQMAQTIQVTFDKLLNVEGNFDSALLSDVERMISVAKDEVTYAISRALSTY